MLGAPSTLTLLLLASATAAPADPSATPLVPDRQDGIALAPDEPAEAGGSAGDEGSKASEEKVVELLASGGDTFAAKCGRQLEHLQPNEPAQAKRLAKVASRASQFRGVGKVPARNEAVLKEEAEALQKWHKTAFDASYWTAAVGTTVADVVGAVVEIAKPAAKVAAAMIPGIGAAFLCIMSIVSMIQALEPKDEKPDPHLECMDLLRTEVYSSMSSAKGAQALSLIMADMSHYQSILYARGVLGEAVPLSITDLLLWVNNGQTAVSYLSGGVSSIATGASGSADDVIGPSSFAPIALLFATIQG